MALNDEIHILTVRLNQRPEQRKARLHIEDLKYKVENNLRLVAMNNGYH